MVWQGNFKQLFIGGQWVKPSSSNTIEVISPFTEQLSARVAAAVTEDVDRAVAAARAAFDFGPWPQLTHADRIDALGRLSITLGDRLDQVATLITEEMGCPITLSRHMQAVVPKMIIDAFLDEAPRYPFRTVRRTDMTNALVTREPVGVVAAIVPWNTPLSTTLMKLTPALIAGCCVILKPAPETPLNSYLLAEMIQASGIPQGVVSILPANRETSEYLVTHPGIDKVTFTGSTAAGQRIASLCGERVRRVTLELGGKSAAVVLDDADLETTVRSLRLGTFRNTGQICSLKTRILVSRKRETELLERLAAMVASMPIGDPMDPATELGPLVSRRQRERVEGYIEIGRDEGATLICGGGRPRGLTQGWFVEPTIFSDVTRSMRIAQEEIFGPVAAVLAYDTEEEAVSIANDSDYGLNGSVFTTDIDHGLQVAARMRTGTVELNGSPVGFHSPIGGWKRSGIGREAGPEGFDAYVELKSIGLPLDFDATHI